ncbi:conserved protein of unknown function [Rhodovastum atsumiense]|uniref:Uncharacterized protein n=1 Tax=Rhodovastum atsumiense TaxID=504468 RepID=A0A5M6IS21_9PROT|nr:hypothetical protein [Rhodovastum atsumiense]KAA5611096.1 hypothetical protein F1189_15990 [Rhodovastum atsumiense]CAH2599159.1 conserved protein of unknown function [Rhodovastum atsumiense]
MAYDSPTELLRRVEILKARANATRFLVRDGTLTPGDGVGRLAVLLWEATYVLQAAAQDHLE